MNQGEVRALKDWLKERLDQEGWTQDSLADELGTTSRTLRKVFNGDDFPGGLLTLEVMSRLGGLSRETPPIKDPIRDRLDRIEALLARQNELAEEEARGLMGEAEKELRPPPSPRKSRRAAQG